MADEGGKAKGGRARAAVLTAERREEIARKGAVSRWGHGVTHQGNFKEAFGLDIECYVLNDAGKTAVIGQRGMAVALLNADSSGSALPRFVHGRVISKALGAEIIQKVDNPLIFKGKDPGAKYPTARRVNGYEVGLLIDICQALVAANARGELLKSHAKIVAQAQIILGASAKAGIQGLVYALAGYDRTKEDVIQAYKMYVMEEAREYEKEFSPELYEHWYRLYGLAKPVRGRPWEFKFLTIDHIYKPLAKSSGKVFTLAKESKKAHGERTDKVHQFLSEIGVKALRTQVGKVTGIASVSKTREEYERHISEQIHGQRALDL